MEKSQISFDSPKRGGDKDDDSTTMQQSADRVLPMAIAIPLPVQVENVNGSGWWQGPGQSVDRVRVRGGEHCIPRWRIDA